MLVVKNKSQVFFNTSKDYYKSKHVKYEGSSLFNKKKKIVNKEIMQLVWNKEKIYFV